MFVVIRRQDALLIWRAKNASMDAACAVDIQLLCGAGLSATKVYLATSTDQNAAAALQYLREYEAAGAFDGFSPGDWMQAYQDYYYLGAAHERGRATVKEEPHECHRMAAGFRPIDPMAGDARPDQ